MMYYNGANERKKKKDKYNDVLIMSHQYKNKKNII